jgi:hypothetical protein
LPNVKELQSLIDFGQALPALPPGHPFPGEGQAFWTSTSFMPWANYAWVVDSGYGNTNEVQKSSGAYSVWPVRDGR